MSLSLVLCLINYLLNVGCDFLSISVARNKLTKVHFTNDTSGTDAKFDCEIQRSTLDPTSDGSCQLYRWFYEPRSNELTCVCTVQDVANINANLLQGNYTSRIIPALPKGKFVELSYLQQGQIAYRLKIRTMFEPIETVRKLFLLGADNDTIKLDVDCKSTQVELNVHYCAALLQYKDNVTWEYPENWSGPARFIKKIAYKENETNVEIRGLFWPMLLHVDTLMLHHRRQSDVCSAFLINIVNETLRSRTKCHVEFFEDSSLDIWFQVAKINLLMPVEKRQFWTADWETFRLINLLQRSGERCKFPILIRKRTASYVPFEYVAEGNQFEYIVTYNMAELETIEELCKVLAKDSRWFLHKCEHESGNHAYGTFAVTIKSKGATVWELQIHLMSILNKKNQEKCHFNVTVKSISKSY